MQEVDGYNLPSGRTLLFLKPWRAGYQPSFWASVQECEGAVRNIAGEVTPDAVGLSLDEYADRLAAMIAA